MTEIKTIGEKIVVENCSRCGGTGIFTWYTSWGKAGGTCFKCGGDTKERYRVKPALTEPQQRKIVGEFERFEISYDAVKQQMRLIVHGKKSITVTSAKHLEAWEPNTQGLDHKVKFANEVRVLNGLSELPVEINLSTRHVTSPALVISTYLASGINLDDKDAISLLGGRLKGNPEMLVDTHLEEAQKLILGYVDFSAGNLKLNDFEGTLSYLVVNDHVAPENFIRLGHLKRVLADKTRLQVAAKAKQDESRWLGSVGDRVQVELKVHNRRIYETRFGSTVFYDCETTDGQLVQVRMSGCLSMGQGQEYVGVCKNAVITGVGTVRELGVYDGRKQTQINRVKLSNIVVGDAGFDS